MRQIQDVRREHGNRIKSSGTETGFYEGTNSCFSALLSMAAFDRQVFMKKRQKKNDEYFKFILPLFPFPASCLSPVSFQQLKQFRYSSMVHHGILSHSVSQSYTDRALCKMMLQYGNAQRHFSSSDTFFFSLLFFLSLLLKGKPS